MSANTDEAEIKITKNMEKNIFFQVKFQITEKMVKNFTELTSDYSSLHTNNEFGRRSMYRANVVHGLLPVIFIAALDPPDIETYQYSFSRISARFIKPVSVNDILYIEAKTQGIDKENKQIEYDYCIKNANTVFTAGTFRLSYDYKEDSKISRNELKSYVFKTTMVMDKLEERALTFKEIQKEDEEMFIFCISEKHLTNLYNILSMGLFGKKDLALRVSKKRYDAINLLATCLFSTFVGMRLPGKYAVFTDFHVEFRRPLNLFNKYLLKGMVEFKSQATSMLVEKIFIYSYSNQQEDYAMGKINIRVDEPALKMPSIEFIKDDESDLRLKDKVVLVTGASRGIGETTAKLFAIYGAKVAINYFKGTKDAERIVDEIIEYGGSALSVGADVSDRMQVKKMVASICSKFGTIGILVNNAVRDYYPKSFLELTWDDFQKEIDVTLKGAFNCCQEILPLMQKNGEGKIINIGTITTDNPPPNQTKYVTAKSGLVGLTRSLAIEFAPYNIQINMVAPSLVETDLTKYIPKIYIDSMKNDTPMKRNANSIDVAKTIVFLASSLSSFTTGQRIMVTGGQSPLL